MSISPDTRNANLIRRMREAGKTDSQIGERLDMTARELRTYCGQLNEALQVAGLPLLPKAKRGKPKRVIRLDPPHTTY